jgi:hypothetical protein
MKTTRYLLFTLSLILSGCVTYPDSAGTLVSADISALRYNPVLMTYEPQPVFVSRSGETLSFRYKGSTPQDLFLSIKKGGTAPYIAAIDKYLDWELLARERGDLFTKKISSIDYASGASILARFQSLAKDKHVVSFGIRSKLLGDDTSPTGTSELRFDRESALRFKALLAAFEGGSLSDQKSDSVYR